jgi:hypothetical protein
MLCSVVDTNVLEGPATSIFFQSSTLKMEAARSSQTSVNTYQTTPCHTQEPVIFMVTTMRTSNLTHNIYFI